VPYSVCLSSNYLVDYGSQGESILSNSPYDLLMNYDDGGATAVDSGEDIGGLVGRETSVAVGNEVEVCYLTLGSEALRDLGIPRGTESVVFRVENGVIVVSPAR
jgi:hypothetical protein